MSYRINRQEAEHGHTKFSVQWGNGPSDRNEMSVTLSRDGCLGVVVEKRFLYPVESSLFVEAMLMALREHESNKIAQRKAWLSENGGRKIHGGAHVDLSINDTQAILRVSPITGDAIFVDGSWLKICETTLTDEVSTGLIDFSRDSLCELVKYGARIRRGMFCIVSAFSDG